MWQADITAWQLASGEVVEILNLIDDHSRLCLGSDAYAGSKRLTSWRASIRLQSCTACRNLCSPTTARSSPAHIAAARCCSSTSSSASASVQELTSLPSADLWEGRAPAPDAQALSGQAAAGAHAHRAPGPARRLRALLQPHQRPHRALGGRTPLQAYSARVKARPAGASAATYFRVREDKVDETGKVSLRYDSRLYKIGIGRAHRGRAVKLLIADQNIRVIDLQGQLIRELTLDPSRNYQPLGQV